MFENLTERLRKTLRHITGSAKLSADNIRQSLSEVRRALLEADVAVEVVQQFVQMAYLKFLLGCLCISHL